MKKKITTLLVLVLIATWSYSQNLQIKDYPQKLINKETSDTLILITKYQLIAANSLMLERNFLEGINSSLKKEKREYLNQLIKKDVIIKQQDTLNYNLRQQISNCNNQNDILYQEMGLRLKKAKRDKIKIGIISGVGGILIGLLFGL